MSEPRSPDVDAALLMLRERFRSASGPTLATFSQIASRLADTPASHHDLAELQRELHRVRGTAGSYGYMDVSRLAETLETRVVRWTADAALDRSQRSAIVEQFVVSLRRCFERPAATGEQPGS